MVVVRPGRNWQGQSRHKGSLSSTRKTPRGRKQSPFLKQHKVSTKKLDFYHRHFGGVASAKGLRGVDVEVEAILVLVPLQKVEKLLQIVHPAHRHEPWH